jgi:hypothetical protein
MASSDRIDELKQKFDENPRRYFAPLANEFRKGGDLDQAILICQEFLPQQPGHMSGHIVYGQALYESGRLDEARGVFDTALSLDPENLIALRHLGDIAGRQGDPATARRWYERVLEADPRNDEIQALLAGLSDARAEGASGPRAFETHAPVHSELSSAAFDAPAHAAVQPTKARLDEPELLDLDVTLPEADSPEPIGAQVASRDASRGPEPLDFDPTTIGDFEPTPETAELMPDVQHRAEGFESTEFAAPPVPVAQTPGLQSAFEDETSADRGAIAPLPGLDRPDIAMEEPARLSTSGGFPELEEALAEDRGEVIPPHGDPIAATAPAPVMGQRDESLLDFEMPAIDGATSAPHHSDEMPAESHPSSNQDTEQLPSVSAIPTELPPEVIAAEAELIDVGTSASEATTDAAVEDEPEPESIGSELSFIDVGDSTSTDGDASDGDSFDGATAEPSADYEPAGVTSAAPEPPRTEPRAFVTETMAELYLQQGFRQEALSVYEQLSTSNPGDDRLSAKVVSLRAELDAVSSSSGPPVRDFFARIAARRPGERSAAAAPPADSDFASPQSDFAGEESAAPPSSPQSSAPPTSGEQRPGGSIDALFGNQPIGTTEDSAASALAQAFGGSGAGADAPPIAGNPTRQASGELTLDSVFREGGARGPRSSQGFSFDQFFSQNVDGERTSGGDRTSGEVPAPGEPAERSEDDIQQFNSWLQGLKQR